MTQAPIIHPVIALLSPFGSQTSKPIGKKGVARMELGFITRVATATKPHAPSHSRHLSRAGIGSSNFRSSCFAGSFGFLTSIFVPQLRQRSASSSFSQPQPWQTFITFYCGSKFREPEGFNTESIMQKCCPPAIIEKVILP